MAGIMTYEGKHPPIRPQVLGIDASLTGTAVCIYDGLTAQVELFKPKKLRGPERLVWLRNQLTDLTAHGLVTHAILEDYSYGSKGQGILNLAEWGGVLRVFLYERGIPVVYVAPTSLKKYTTGKGNADKAMMAEAIFNKYDVDHDLFARPKSPKPDDNKIDAYALARLGYNYLAFKQGYTMFEDYELECLHKIENHNTK